MHLAGSSEHPIELIAQAVGTVIGSDTIKLLVFIIFLFLGKR